MPALKKAKKQATKAKAATKKAKAATTKVKPATTKVKPATTKVKAATKKSGGAAARRRPDESRTALTTVAVGDVVRFSGDVRNQMKRYDANTSRDTRGAEAIEGIVCSIRNISTGKGVGKTRGDVSGYVLEIVHHQTFQLHYASDRNTGGPRGAENVRNNPTWARVREVLVGMADKRQFMGSASRALDEEPLRSLLDGWRVVKVRADRVQSAT